MSIDRFLPPEQTKPGNTNKARSITSDIPELTLRDPRSDAIFTFALRPESLLEVLFTLPVSYQRERRSIQNLDLTSNLALKNFV